jgi:hypothetical protein
VPIHLTATEVQGVKYLKSIAELPDPKNTAVCIVVLPAVSTSTIAIRWTIELSYLLKITFTPGGHP